MRGGGTLDRSIHRLGCGNYMLSAIAGKTIVWQNDFCYFLFRDSGAGKEGRIEASLFGEEISVATGTVPVEPRAAPAASRGWQKVFGTLSTGPRKPNQTPGRGR